MGTLGDTTTCFIQHYMLISKPFWLSLHEEYLRDATLSHAFISNIYFVPKQAYKINIRERKNVRFSKLDKLSNWLYY